MQDGLIIVGSRHSYSETLDLFRSAVGRAGLTIFAEIDHGRNAAEVDLTLRPTTLFLIGNPRAGTPLMQLDQRVAIDLPFRVAVWQAADGATQIAYNDPAWLADRYALGEAAEPVWSAIANGMDRLIAAVSG